MIENIQKYAAAKNISLKDALQVFMQVIVLKNLRLKGVRLIGGTALVMGYANPRFSEDIDLTNVADPQILRSHLEKGIEVLGGLLTAKPSLRHPKKDRITWRISCQMNPALSAVLHVDSQPYPSITHYPVMVEYPGMPPFVFPSVALDEILADKLNALAFRRNMSGRDIFDLWYHWLKFPDFSQRSSLIIKYVREKLAVRKLKEGEFVNNLHAKFENGLPKRIKNEWSRYLPPPLKDEDLFRRIFETVKLFTVNIDL